MAKLQHSVSPSWAKAFLQEVLQQHREQGGNVGGPRDPAEGDRPDGGITVNDLEDGGKDLVGEEGPTFSRAGSEKGHVRSVGHSGSEVEEEVSASQRPLSYVLGWERSLSRQADDGDSGKVRQQGEGPGRIDELGIHPYGEYLANLSYCPAIRPTIQRTASRTTSGRLLLCTSR